MNTSEIVTEIKKVADHLEALNIYNDPESAFEAALKVVQIQVAILSNADNVLGNLKWLDRAVDEITSRQDV